MLTRVGRFLFLAASVYACSIAFAEELTVTNPVLSNLRPWCVGRFVFDRPAASVITNERYEFQGEKLETQYNVTRAIYQAKVDGLEGSIALSAALILQTRTIVQGLLGSRRRFLRQALQEFLSIKKGLQRLPNYLSILKGISTKIKRYFIQPAVSGRRQLIRQKRSTTASIAGSRPVITGRCRPNRDSVSTAGLPQVRRLLQRKCLSRLR